MALALLSNYATTTCVRMQPRFFIKAIMPFFLAQSSRVCLILPTHRGSFKCELKCFNAPFPNFEAYCFPHAKPSQIQGHLTLQELHMDFIRLPCWWRKLQSPPNMRFFTNKCFQLIISSQIVQYSRNAYKQYESFANTLTKLCFHYHQNVNTIKFSNCM